MAGLGLGLGLVVMVSAGTGCGVFGSDVRPGEGGAEFEGREPVAVRPVRAFSDDGWIGPAVAYGPFRDGQYPGGPSPTRDQLHQDLQLMSRHWKALRTYGVGGPSETLVPLIHETGREMKVMLGVWIAVEERRNEAGRVLERFPEAAAQNRREIESAVRLANAYPEIVIAVSVGNETQVFWSAHRSPLDILIRYVREIRARTKIPITVADDFNFWNKPESKRLARELDFIVVHAHPLWNGVQVEDALDWVRDTLAEVQAVHPERDLVLGETGWATRKHTEGEQARLMRGRVGEAEQKMFYQALTRWADRERVPVFFFEAFDENWKGGEHPDEVEKHWGLFRADRTPKAAVAGGPAS